MLEGLEGFGCGEFLRRTPLNECCSTGALGDFLVVFKRFSINKINIFDTNNKLEIFVQIEISNSESSNI